MKSWGSGDPKLGQGRQEGKKRNSRLLQQNPQEPKLHIQHMPNKGTCNDAHLRKSGILLDRNQPPLPPLHSENNTRMLNGRATSLLNKYHTTKECQSARDYISQLLTILVRFNCILKKDINFFLQLCFLFYFVIIEHHICPDKNYPDVKMTVFPQNLLLKYLSIHINFVIT